MSDKKTDKPALPLLTRFMESAVQDITLAAAAYDEGQATKETLADRIRVTVQRTVEQSFDFGFAMGVTTQLEEVEEANTFDQIYYDIDLPEEEE